jgi:hypothetical protein
MVDVSQLPRDPKDALVVVLRGMIASYASVSVPVEALKSDKHALYLDLLTNIAISKKCAGRLHDETLRSVALEYLNYNDTERLSVIAKRIAKLLEAVIALSLDDHFLPQLDVESYDQATLTTDERDQVRQFLSKARELTLRSKDLADGQKRRVCYRISQVENELYKEKSAFGTFMAAAYEVSALVRQIGGDVKPIAEAIEQAKTITEKKVTGYQQIEAEAEPKKLPKPDPGHEENA